MAYLERPRGLGTFREREGIVKTLTLASSGVTAVTAHWVGGNTVTYDLNGCKS